MTVLDQNPDSTEAKEELDETLVLIRERNEEDDLVDSDDATPSLESVSDSSDWNHEENGRPCRDYNHDGCTRGLECKFSHAPDHKSVRDRLCVFSPGLEPALTLGDGQRTQRLCALFNSGSADLKIACIPTTRPICQQAGGGRVKRNGSVFGIF